MSKKILRPQYKCLRCNYEWKLVYYSDDTPVLLRTCPNCGEKTEPIKLK